MTQKRYVTTEQAAEALGVDSATIRVYLKAGKLTGKRHGGKFRAIWEVDVTSILKLIEDGGRSSRGMKQTRQPNPAVLEKG